MRRLSLLHNNISDDGATAIAEALKANWTLEDLCLYGNDDIVTRSVLVRIERRLSRLRRKHRLEMENPESVGNDDQEEISAAKKKPKLF